MLFNDPFDVQRCFDLGFDSEELEEPLTREIVNLLSRREIPDLSRNPRLHWLVSTLRKDDHTTVRETIVRELPGLIATGIQQAKRQLEVIRKQWSEFLPEFRILCLSAIRNNMLMWSHYSDSHKGVVLGFQPKHDNSFFWAALPVRYQDSPPMIATKEEWVRSITAQQPIDADEWQLYEPLALTKTTAWEYEKEWRVVSFMRKGESGLHSDYGFDPRELRSVNLGCEISEEDADVMIALLKYDLAHVTVWRGRKSERERRISFDRIDR